MAKNKKIVIVLPNLAGGGAQWVLSRLSNTLVEFFEVFIITFEKSDKEIVHKNNNLRIIYLGTKTARKSFFILKKELEILKPDLIFSSLIQTNILLIILSKFLKFKHKLIIRETNTFIEPIKYKKNLINLFYYIIRFSYHFVSNIIAPSEGVCNEINKYLLIPKNKIHVLYSPFFHNEIINLSNEDLKINIEEKYLVAVGRLAEQKNFDFLIHSFAKIYKKVEYKLVIVGNGVKKNSLNSLITKLGLINRVIILDNISNPIPLIAESIGLVQCSKWEGLSNVLLHAITLNKLIICTDYNYGPQDIINMGYNITIVDNNIDNLAEAMLKIKKIIYDNDKIQKDDVIHKNNYINYLLKLIDENITYNK